MPQIKIYVSDDVYINFLQKTIEERTEIRKEAAKVIIEETNKKLDDQDDNTI